MKKLFFATLAVCMLINTYGQNQNSGIQVSGMAERSLTADMILLDIEISAEHEKAAEAQQQTSTRAEAVIKFLKSQSSVQKVETSYIYLRPMHLNSDDKKTRYHSAQGISFRIMDMKAYDQILKGLMERGVNGINSLGFDSSQREKIEEDLLAEAIRDAREKADYMAAQLGQEAGRATFVTDQQGNYGMPITYRKMDMMESSSIEPRELKIVKEVQIIFELK